MVVGREEVAEVAQWAEGIERALESRVPFAWVAGDEDYGSGRKLRLWLEREGIPHVLARRGRRWRNWREWPGPGGP